MNDYALRIWGNDLDDRQPGEEEPRELYEM